MLIFIYIILSLYLLAGCISTFIFIWGDWEEVKKWPYLFLIIPIYIIMGFFVVPMILLSWIEDDDAQECINEIKSKKK